MYNNSATHLMDQNSNKDLVLAMGKFSDLLIKRNIIDPNKDENAICKAMSNVAIQLISSNSLNFQLASPEHLKKDPLASLMSKYEKSKQRIEEKRRLRNEEELAQLQSKPLINKNSSKLVKKMPPLHLRTDQVIERFSKKIESQRNMQKLNEDEVFYKTCTFRPSSRASSRSHESLTEDLYKWNEKRNYEITTRIKAKEKIEEKIMKKKPRIDKLSIRLSKERCATPVYERLSTQKEKLISEINYSFFPITTEKHKEILKTKQATIPVNKLNNRIERTKNSFYKINSSHGTIDNHQINLCKLSKF